MRRTQSSVCMYGCMYVHIATAESSRVVIATFPHSFRPRAVSVVELNKLVPGHHQSAGRSGSALSSIPAAWQNMRQELINCYCLGVGAAGGLPFWRLGVTAAVHK